MNTVIPDWVITIFFFVIGVLVILGIYVFALVQLPTSLSVTLQAAALYFWGKALITDLIHISHNKPPAYPGQMYMRALVNWGVLLFISGFGFISNAELPQIVNIALFILVDQATEFYIRYTRKKYYVKESRTNEVATNVLVDVSRYQIYITIAMLVFGLVYIIMHL